MGPEAKKCECAPYRSAPTAQRYDKTFAANLHSVSTQFEVQVVDVLGKGRTRRATEARHELWRRLHQAGWSLSEIGRRCDRDHTTVLAALKKN